MKKNLFLLGDIAVGKSTMIRENLLPHLAQVGGFYVQRIFIGERIAAFKLNPLQEAGKYQLNAYVSGLAGLDSLFLYSDEAGQWHKDLAVFAGCGRACLKESLAAGKDLILLDELGGIELACPDFMEAVLEVLDSEVPALGVMKSPQNVERLESGLGGKWKLNSAENSFLNRLQAHPHLELRNVTKENYQAVSVLVQNFIKEALQKNG